MRLPYLIIAVLLCAFVPLALSAEDETGDDEAQITPIPTIVKRVEELRALRFKAVPEPERVSAEQARTEGLEALDRDYPADQQAADEAIYKLLDLVPDDTDLRDLSGSIFEDEVSGYYDPIDGRLRIVDDGLTKDPIIGEMVLAHELAHALEDQAIGFEMERLEESDDRALAYKGLVEGSATLVMFDYLQRHLSAGDALGSLLATGDTSTGLPKFIEAGLLFQYVDGFEFARRLFRKGGNTYTLLDSALRDRPPVSTEQILHPQKWIEVEEPDEVDLPAAPDGFERLAEGSFGEFQTGAWLEDPTAAAGWGGDRYALYGRGEQRRLVMRYVWDTPADLNEFAAAVRGRADGVDVSGGAVTLTFSD